MSNPYIDDWVDELDRDYLLHHDTSGRDDRAREYTDAFARKEAQYGAILNDEQPLATFQRLQSEISSQGTSAEIEDHRRFYLSVQEEKDKQDLRQIINDPEITDEDRLKYFNRKKLQILERGDPDTYEVALERSKQFEASRIIEEKGVQDFRIANSEDIARTQRLMENIKNEVVATGSTNPTRMTVDFLRSAFLPGFGIRQGLANDAAVEQSFSDFVLAGESIQKVTEKMLSLPLEERVKMMEQLVKGADEWNSWLFPNNIERAWMIENLLSDINPRTAANDPRRALNNIFGVVDLIPFFRVGGRVIYRGLTARMRKSPLGTLDEVAPGRAQDLRAAALTDEEAQQVAGEAREDIIASSILPRMDDGLYPKVGPDMNAKLDEDVLQDLTDHNIRYSTGEKASAQNRTQQALDEVANLPGVEKVSDTTVLEHIPGGYRARQTYSATDKAGFNTPQALVDSLWRQLESQDAVINVYQRNMPTGTYELVDTNTLDGLDDALRKGEFKLPAGQQGEYVADVEVQHIYNPTDAKGAALDNQIVGVAGPLSRFFDKATVWDKFVERASNRASDATDAARGALAKLIRPLTNLPKRRKSAVLSVIDEGDNFLHTDGSRGKWFTREELITKFDGDEDLIEAYNGVVRHQGRIAEISNRKLRQDMVAGRYQAVSFGDEYLTVARPVDEVDAVSVRSAWDPATNTVRDLSESEVAELYRKGARLGSLRTKKMIDKTRTSHVLIDNVNGKLRRLPSQVLNIRPGYVTKEYLTTHVVYKQLDDVFEDGVKVSGGVQIPVGMSADSRRAGRLAGELTRNSENGEQFFVRQARELDEMDFVNQNSQEFYETQNAMFFSKRGNELESALGDRARTLKDIEASLHKAASRAAHFVGDADFLETMTNRWTQRYSKFTQNGEFPMDPNIPLIKPNVGRNDPDMVLFREATAARDWLHRWYGINDSATKRWWNNAHLWVADRVAGINGTVLSRFLSDDQVFNILGGFEAAVLKNRLRRDPVQFSKRLAFNTYIALNPFRQLLLQMQSASWYVGVEGGTAYMGTRFVPEFTTLSAGKAALARGGKEFDQVVPVLAKAALMTVEEYKAFQTAWRRSGLDPYLNNHLFALDQTGKINNRLPQTMGNNILSKARQRIQDVGFSTGEYANIATSWLTTRNREIQRLLKEGKTLPQARKIVDQGETAEVIAADARSFALNMNKAGGTGFNDGMAGFVFQFMTHQWKAVQAMIPDTKILGLNKLANKQFTNSMRLKIFGSQLALYGTAGMGAFGDPFERFVKESEGLVDWDQEVGDTGMDLRSFSEQGLIGTTVGLTFSVMDPSNEPAVLDFSENFSPLSGVSEESLAPWKIINQIYNLIWGGGLEWREVMPPAASLFGKLHEQAVIAGKIFDHREALDLSTPESLLRAVEQMGKILPVYNNIWQGRMQMATDHAFNSLGDPNFEVTYGEALARQWFGIRTQKEGQLTDLYEKAYGSTQDIGVEGELQEVEQAAEDFHNWAVRGIRAVNNGEMDQQMYFDLLDSHNKMWSTVLTDYEKFQFETFVYQKMYKTLDRENNPALLGLISRLLAKNSSTFKPDFVDEIRRMPPFDGQEEVIDFLEGMLSFDFNNLSKTE